MSLRICWLLVATVALVVWASHATVATAASLTGLAVASGDSVLLAGDSVLWSETVPEPGRPLWESGSVIYRVLQDGARAELLRIPAPRRGRLSFGPALAASERLVAIGVGEEEYAADGSSDPLWSEVRVGPPTGPLSVKVSRELSVDVHGFALSGETLATFERQVPRASRCIVRVRELSSGRTHEVAQPLACRSSGVGATVRLAGAWVARLSTSGSRSRIDVFKWETGELAYTVAVPSPLIDVSFELQDDGTIAVDTHSDVIGAASDLNWASASEPWLHPILAPRRASRIQLAGGQIAYLRGRVSKSHGASAEVVVQPLNSQARVVSFPVASASFDFDGSHIALLTGRCVYGGDVSAGSAPAGPPLGMCPGVDITLTPELDSYPRPGLAWNRASRTLTTRVFCELAGPDGCAGSLTVTGTNRLTGKPKTLAAGSFRAVRFGLSTTRLRIASAALAALRTTARRRARVTVTAIARDASGRQVSTRRSMLLRQP